MKSKILTVLFVAITHFALAQAQKNITQLSDANVVKVLNEVEVLATNASDNLAVKIYKIDNGMKNLNITGGKVAYSVFVAVANKTANPQESVFDMRAFYNPTFVEWKEATKDATTFVLAYTENNKQKQVTLKATVNGISVVE